MAVVLAMLIVGGAATAPPAAAFSFTITVTGDDIAGSGVVAFPADAGSSPAGVDLLLDATLFGHAVTFTEAEIQSLAWTGATPGDALALVVENLGLATIVGANAFLLTDDGGGFGDAICAPCEPEILVAAATWTYTSQDTQAVPEPSTAVVLLVALGFAMARCVVRRSAHAVVALRP